MLWGKRHDLTAMLRAHGLTACIQTAFIERVNLTLRQGIALLTRKNLVPASVRIPPVAPCPLVAAVLPLGPASSGSARTDAGYGARLG